MARHSPGICGSTGPRVKGRTLWDRGRKARQWNRCLWRGHAVHHGVRSFARACRCTSGVEEALSLRGLSYTLKQVEALVITDRARTQEMEENKPDWKNTNGIHVIRVTDEGGEDE